MSKKNLNSPPVRVSIPFSQALGMLGAYGKRRVFEQMPSVLFIVLYLVFFQVVILGLPLPGALSLCAGILLVILGLAFFIEGLTLGLMPLGETIGVRLPVKASLFFVLTFAFLLGFGATLAEPAVGALKMAGAMVKPWDAPLLAMLLGSHSWVLITGIGLGVGLAVLLSILRFYYHWSLKPLIFIIIPIAAGLSIWANQDPKLHAVVGLAWDSGAITTGPVTVPLCLALGLGITRITGKGESPLAGFGIVTLASAIPVITVLISAAILAPSAPGPMSYAQYVHSGLLTVSSSVNENIYQDLFKLFISSVQSVLPLSAFLLVTLILIREKIHRLDEIILGIILALVGMFFLNAGLEWGLTPLGSEVGQGLPAAVKVVQLPQEAKDIPCFSESLIYSSIDAQGKEQSFFYYHLDDKTYSVPYDANRWDHKTGIYHYIPSRGPLFGSQGFILGLGLLILFAFLMGVGATLAEPALIALGKTVEEISVGTFKAKQLLFCVALGVGTGIGVGVIKILYQIPLLYLLLIPYGLLLVLSIFSDEAFVNVAWDSAGVTTGPVTVPLVIAMGVGLGGQMGASDAFGVLALASAFPVLTVLSMGFLIRIKRNHLFR